MQNLLRKAKPIPSVLLSEYLLKCCGSEFSLNVSLAAQSGGEFVSRYGLKEGREIEIRSRQNFSNVSELIWPSSLIMAEYVLRKELIVVENRNVVELGCGLGLMGICCLEAGCSYATLTDNSETGLCLARENVKAALPDRKNYSIEALDWRDYSQEDVLKQVDECVVLIADCWYADVLPYAEDQSRMVRNILTRHPNNEAFVTCADRNDGVAGKFCQIFKDNGLELVLIEGVEKIDPAEAVFPFYSDLDILCYRITVS